MGAANDGGPGDAAPTNGGPFALTIAEIPNGGIFPAPQTCRGGSISPTFMWTPGPAATKSYGIFMTDKTNGLKHWAIWDIAPTITTIPPMLTKTTNTITDPIMARQASIHHGYAGPCPDAPQNHTYEFALYAFDVAMLPGLANNAVPMAVEPVMLAHQIAKTSMSATSLGVGPKPADPP